MVSNAKEANWEADYRSGEEQLRLGRTEAAWRQLRVALKSAESEHADATALSAILDALGRVQFTAGGYRRAIDYFERGLRLAGKPGEQVVLLCNAGQAYREMGDLSRAEKRVREALAIAPDQPKAWQLLGSVLTKRRRYPDAEAAERKAVALGDAEVAASAWSDLAAIHESQGQLDQAQQELNRALATATVGQQRARVLTNVAGVEQKLHRFDDSVAHLRQALEEMEAAVGSRHPDVARILDFYAAALRRAGHATSAKQAAQRAREIRSVLATTVDWRELQ